MADTYPITWDNVGERLYETGVSNVVLYPLTGTEYTPGVAWNGVSSISESPSGAEATAIYANNIKYLSLMSNEEFGATIEAYMYPDEFEECDGTADLCDGVTVGQQTRKTFGLAYKTLIGSDTEGTAKGYKLHLVYGCLASPSEKAHSTVNDSPEAVSFSWTITTTPVSVTGLKPTATVTIDSTKVDATKLENFEKILYGSGSTAPKLPLPDAVKAAFSAT